ANFQRVTTDVFRDRSDEIVIVLLLVVVALAFWLSRRGGEERADDVWFERRSLRWRYAAVVPICLVGYLLLDNQLGDVYLLADRFGVPLLLCLIPLLRWPSGTRGWVTSGAAALVGALAIGNVCLHFQRVEVRETGHFDRALRDLETGQRTIGLMFDR